MVAGVAATRESLDHGAPVPGVWRGFPRVVAKKSDE
jgi:hypothetical protein